jgi:uncharacterized protein YqjF (DUF2071 family)
MAVTKESRRPAAASSIDARESFMALEGEPFLIADWEGALFLHYAIAPRALQPYVPFELDRFDGRAFVSLVAFTMRRMRFARGGRLGAWLCASVSEQRLLNLRTYVRYGKDSGIYFMAEWVSHWLCAQLGPSMFGLPYHWARLAFQHAPRHGCIEGRVEARHGNGTLSYSTSRMDECDSFATCEPDSLDAFLLERYVAFTSRGADWHFFRVWHHPWLQAQVKLERIDGGLPDQSVPCWSQTCFVGANFSPGVFGVWMGPPHRVGRVCDK